MYLALDLERTEPALHGIEEQHMTVERVPLADVPDLIRSRRIVDGKSIIGLMLALAARPTDRSRARRGRATAWLSQGRRYARESASGRFRWARGEEVIAVIVGVPAEIKTAEDRVAMTPDGVRELAAHGHRRARRAGARAGSSISDGDFAAAGARIVDVEEAWGAELVVKVKEPQPEEFGFLRRDQLLFTYLHLAAYPEVANALLAAGTTGPGLRDGRSSPTAPCPCWPP